jgi:hypothetical protein
MCDRFDGERALEEGCDDVDEWDEDEEVVVGQEARDDGGGDR